METVSRLKPDLVTMDMTMPGADGIECIQAIRTVDPDVKVIIVSSMMDDEIVRRAQKAKISGYVQKPIRSISSSNPFPTFRKSKLQKKNRFPGACRSSWGLSASTAAG